MIYVNLGDTTLKGIFFYVYLFFLLTITGRNKAIIVELKAIFVLNGTFITFSGCYHNQITLNYEKWCQLSPLIS